jgi:hypothetical protein
MIESAIAICVLAGSCLALMLWRTKREKSLSKRGQQVRQATSTATHVPRHFLPIMPPAHPCGHGTAPPAMLASNDSIVSARGSYIVWEVELNGERVHHPLVSPLAQAFKCKIRTVADVERIACKFPTSEWLIRYTEPLQSLVYQRHNDGDWNLVKVGTGMF